MGRTPSPDFPMGSNEPERYTGEMPDLLLELGCEELPAHSVASAYAELADKIERALAEAAVPFEMGNPPIGTPRRLIVHFQNVAERQPDQEKEVRGPAVGSAYDESGNPTKAMEGFCRGQGVDPKEAKTIEGYVWVTKKSEGRPTTDILAEILPQAIRGLTFDKTMRWGSSRMRFARPIRWILASFGGKAVSFDIEGVQSGLNSYGHRFYAPEAFEAKTHQELVDSLIARKVEPDPAERRARIVETSLISASGKPEMPEALIDENTFLTEWPTPVEGSFSPEYLDLPEPVLITAMAKHEKMFPIRDGSGKLMNKFIFIRNSGEDDTVRAGTEWVLNARFNDAKFFFDEDKKFSMEDFLKRTEQIVFQEQLGTVRQRADRLSTLAAEICKRLGGSESDQALASKAGLYAKADLSSGLVSELASLQGVVGGEYAKRNGFDPAVCEAIANQYSGRPCANRSVGLSVVLADQIDKLAGYLGIGQVPSGSSDPMGLRRAMTIVIEQTWDAFPLDVAELLRASLRSFQSQGVSLDENGAVEAAKSIAVARYGAVAPDVEYDVMEAAIMADYGLSSLQPQAVKSRIETCQLLSENKSFLQTASRPLNILKSAREKGFSFDESPTDSTWTKLNSAEGQALLAVVQSLSLDGKSPQEVALALLSIDQPVNAFFEATMIMSQDESERHARLSLVALVCQKLLVAGDLTKIVLEG